MILEEREGKNNNEDEDEVVEKKEGGKGGVNEPRHTKSVRETRNVLLCRAKNNV